MNRYGVLCLLSIVSGVVVAPLWFAPWANPSITAISIVLVAVGVVGFGYLALTEGKK